MLNSIRIPYLNAARAYGAVSALIKRKELRQLRLEIQQNGSKVYGGIIPIPDMFSGVGSRILFLIWKLT